MSYLSGSPLSQLPPLSQPAKVPEPVHTMTSKCVAEFLGTFLLVFTIGCNVLLGSPVWAGVSIASVLMVAIYSLGKVSGGHFNPGVTFALFVARNLGCKGIDTTSETVGMYWASQVAGGVVAGFAYTLLFKDSVDLAPGKNFGWLEAGTCELLYTFMLCFVVLNVACAKRREDANNEYYGLAIGFVIIAGAYGAGAVSGGCFNPAVAIGINISDSPLRPGWSAVYTLFELAGAALAAALFSFVRPEEAGSVAPKDLPHKLTSEFLGTFFLVLTVGLNVLAGSTATAFSIAASLMCMIYALGDVSGAHFNPAVTLAAFASGQCPDLQIATAATYVMAQLVGGLCAQLVFYRIYPGQPSITLGPKTGFGWSDVVVAETVFTFVLCLAVLSSAVHKKTKNGTIFGLIIGSCVTVGGFAIGSISGGCLNPAVAFALDAPHLMSGVGFKRATLYSICEFVGAGLAAGAVIFTHGREKELGQP